MSIGALPLSEGGVRSLIDRKMSDFAHVAGALELRHLNLDAYRDAAAEIPDIRFALDTGLIDGVEEVRDPVVTYGTALYTCPSLAVAVLASEPAELHRPFVEGTFFRKLFLHFVPAAQDGATWEAAGQVREIMQRHFALQLIAAEAVLGEAA